MFGVGDGKDTISRMFGLMTLLDTSDLFLVRGFGVQEGDGFVSKPFRPQMYCLFFWWF